MIIIIIEWTWTTTTTIHTTTTFATWSYYFLGSLVDTFFVIFCRPRCCRHHRHCLEHCMNMTKMMTVTTRRKRKIYKKICSSRLLDFVPTNRHHQPAQPQRGKNVIALCWKTCGGSSWVGKKWDYKKMLRVLWRGKQVFTLFTRLNIVQGLMMLRTCFHLSLSVCVCMWDDIIIKHGHYENIWRSSLSQWKNKEMETMGIVEE